MVIQTADGWILDVSHEYDTDDINLLIKLQDGKVISFKQKLKERVFYILPEILNQLKQNCKTGVYQ
jgi:hypothetical protein